ncbi:MarR family winged helix-turn-helix transcriptional regulator [Beijerinckia indica]|uniref:Transcriptional regulator, MarR family n=1 Tax=Beijerinckia indica subsp. indica (strain ATCC 9039 / DSM 1715 / NCIMB 8712) TaxID=395963 RepID=B2IKX7_BEII9|nr:MarR family transcriptional regulator [Beijerinckia indica]ACB96517.1 transcriptional regulator, MarR family [Beijerinckia indica subsp. indica ATCC 9039]
MSIGSDHHQTARASALAQDLRAFVGKMKRRLRDQGHVGDLTPSQVSVLLRLEKDGSATASTLARAEGMRPQSMAPVIAALEKAGLVSGAPDPADGRQTLISLTDACRKWIEEGRAARQDWLTRTLQARLSPKELDEVAKAVEHLMRLVDD